MLKSMAFLLLTIFAVNVYGSDYQIDSKTWSFELISDTCAVELEEAIGLLELPAGTVITYPQTIGYEYFKIQFQQLGSEKTFAYEFKYWANDEHSVCERVDVEGIDE